MRHLKMIKAHISFGDFERQSIIFNYNNLNCKEMKYFLFSKEDTIKVAIREKKIIVAIANNWGVFK